MAEPPGIDIDLDVDHRWDLAPDEAVALQKRLSTRISNKSLKRADEISLVGGVDAAYCEDRVQAAVVLFNLTTRKTIESVRVSKQVAFPYVPGLLSFRETPAILDALEKLQRLPDVLMVDGQGIAHPRRFGIACHVGLLTSLPAIGCAKTRLVGNYTEPNNEKGSMSLMSDGKDTIGAVLRTRTGVKPVYVSTGHLISLENSVTVVLNACQRYRLPEPLRLANHLSRT